MGSRYFHVCDWCGIHSKGIPPNETDDTFAPNGGGWRLFEGEDLCKDCNEVREAYHKAAKKERCEHKGVVRTLDETREAGMQLAPKEKIRGCECGSCTGFKQSSIAHKSEQAGTPAGEPSANEREEKTP